MANYKIYAPLKDKWQKACEADYSQLHNVSCHTYENVYIEAVIKAPTGGADTAYIGGVCHQDGTFIAGLQRSPDNIKLNSSVYDSYKLEEKDADYLEGEYIFGGVIMNVYGHIISEVLSRLWYVIQNPDNTDKIIFVSIGDTISSTFWMVMEALGISKERIIIVTNRSLKIDKIIVPDQSMMQYGHFSKEYCSINDKMVELAMNQKPADKVYNKNIFLTKTELVGNPHYNEKYFVEFYKKRGYDIVAPEKLPFDEQIRIIASADHVVTVCGTLSVMASLYQPNNSKLTILLRVNELGGTKTQLILNQARNLNCEIIDTSMNLMPAVQAGGMYYLGPSRFWKNYLDDNKIEYEQSELEMDWSYLKDYFFRFNKWCAGNGYVYRRLKNFDFWDILNGMNYVFNGTVLDRVKMDTKSKVYYMDQVSSLEKSVKAKDTKIAELENTVNSLNTGKIKPAIDLVTVPDCLKIIAADNKKVKLLTINCGNTLTVNGAAQEYDSYCAKLTKKYNAVNKQWRSLLGIPYAYINGKNYDQLLYMPENTTFSLNSDDISKLNQSAIDAVFESYEQLERSIKDDYINKHGEETWDIISDVLSRLAPDYDTNNVTRRYSINCFIMKKQCFINYAEWLLPILNDISGSITSKEMSLLPAIAEVLTTIYFNQHKDKHIVAILD